MKFLFLLITIGLFNSLLAQNYGVGTSDPLEKLDVNGTTKSNGLIVIDTSAVNNFLTKNNATGDIGFKKGHGAQGINYIICIQGIFPSPNRVLGEPGVMGQIRILAGNIIPAGWALCNGQLLPLNTNQALFSLIGYTYGGSGSQFALPDLRGCVPVGQGTNPAGYTWPRALKSD